MPMQLTPTECQRIDSIMRVRKQTPADALEKINQARKRRRVEPTTHTTVAGLFFAR